MTLDEPKPLLWRGSSKADYMAFPADVRREMGYALFLAQMGERHPRMVKTLKGFGGGIVVEVKESHDGTAYRAVYTVRFSDAVYVLHAFQKKSTTGIKTSKIDLNTVERRLRELIEEKEKAPMKRTSPAKDPKRNVWLQLGFPDAEEHYLKAELVLRLDKAIKALGLTQRMAARRIGTTQPELSKILGGKFSEVSFERLLRFLTALGHHIEIKIGAAEPKKAGNVTVTDAGQRAA